MTAHNQFKDFATMRGALALLAPVNAGSRTFICLGKNGRSGEMIGNGTMQYVGFEREPAKVASYYRASDIYIHAAKADTFPKTIAEAMACGVAVVATDNDGIPELTEDGVTGWLVPPGDPRAMAHAVETLLQNAAWRARIGREASMCAKERFNLDRQVVDFTNWYEEVIDDWSQWRCPPHATALCSP
jgi:glycosyltransferase involved in cell wall biosynthesis